MASSSSSKFVLPKDLVATDASLQRNYERIKEEVTRKAMQVLQEIIPQKMKEFDDMMPINSEPLTLMKMDDFPANQPIYTVPNIRIQQEGEEQQEREKDGEEEEPTTRNHINENGKRIRTIGCQGRNGEMKLPEYIYTSYQLTNVAICDRVERMKIEATELLELVACVKLWIQLNIPRIEDGNNFGVAIQEDVIHELSRVEEAAFNLRDTTSKYYLQRAKLVTKIIKYPNVQDYRLTLKELDEKQWFQMKITVMDTRNNYAIIYDMLFKNWHKVVRPRTTDGSMMVY